MGKERKNKSKKTRVGISFENAVLELLDEFAARQSSRDRSAANNYILKKHFKSQPISPYSEQTRAQFKSLMAF